jgi:hypothetical protein
MTDGLSDIGQESEKKISTFFREPVEGRIGCDYDFTIR